MIGYANISPCGKYRYELGRFWNHGSAGPSGMAAVPNQCEESADFTKLSDKKQLILFVGLNPSTATATTNDPTIKKLIRLAMRLGYDGLLVGNLFAWRSPSPASLLSAPSSEGDPQNLASLTGLAKRADRCVVSWGNDGCFRSRDATVVNLLRPHFGGRLWCLRKNKTGAPAHPLYLPAGSPLIPY